MSTTSTSAIELLNRRGAKVTYQPDFFAPDEADRQLAALLAEVQFSRPEESRVFVHGRWRAIPRLQVAYGDDGTSYRFSGCTVPARPWSQAPTLQGLRQKVREALRDGSCEETNMMAGFDPNFVLLNLYRNGADSIGWHSDDESDLGLTPSIVSLSLGAARDFQLRRRDAATSRVPTVTLRLEHGSLLRFDDPTNKHWMHQLPKRGGTHPERIGLRLNLTWRRIV